MPWSAVAAYHCCENGGWRYSGKINSSSNSQRGVELPQGCEDRKGRDPSRLGVLRGDVLDREREAGGITVDLDSMTVALDRGVRPDLHHRAIGADAGKRQCGGYVDVGGKARRPVAGGPGEHPLGRLEPLDRDAVRLEIRRPGKP